MNETRPIPAPLVSLPFTECSEDDKEVGAALHSLTSGLRQSNRFHLRSDRFGSTFADRTGHNVKTIETA